MDGIWSEHSHLHSDTGVFTPCSACVELGMLVVTGVLAYTQQQQRAQQCTTFFFFYQVFTSISRYQNASELFGAFFLQHDNTQLSSFLSVHHLPV